MRNEREIRETKIWERWETEREIRDINARSSSEDEACRSGATCKATRMWQRGVMTNATTWWIEQLQAKGTSERYIWMTLSLSLSLSLSLCTWLVISHKIWLIYIGFRETLMGLFCIAYWIIHKLIHFVISLHCMRFFHLCILY